MQQELGLYTSTMIATYYRKFIPPKKVVKDLDMYGMIQSFKLPSEVGDHLLCGDTQDNEQCDPETIKLHLKDETDSSILDLGNNNYVRTYIRMCPFHLFFYSRKYIILGKCEMYVRIIIHTYVRTYQKVLMLL